MPACILASCSDDRTIKLWDISISSEKRPSENVGACLGSVSGHASRIWSVRFLQHESTLRLLSSGEDGTSQLWQVVFSQERKIESGIKFAKWKTKISHAHTYGYHTGKNVWASAISRLKTHVIATGGADGRVVTYNSDLDVKVASSRDVHCTTQEATKSLVKSIYDAMMGRWKLSRTIKSHITSQPSGQLEGIADMHSVQVTDDAYDCEAWYSEKGDFATDLGFTMKASRQYVYRYQKTSDEISVWFVKPDGSSVDYLFHKLLFDKESASSSSNGESITATKASGHHLCERDTYLPEYIFRVKDRALLLWQIQYTVKGPEKDYVSTANYMINTDIGEEQKSVVSISKEAPISELVTQAKTKADTFKAYAWLSESEFLATTEQGSVLLGHLASSQKNEISTEDKFDKHQTRVTWQVVGHNSDLASASMITCVPSQNLALVTGNEGAIYVYLSTFKAISLVHKVGRKLGYLKAHECPVAWTANGSEQREEMVALVFRALGNSSLQTVSLRAGDPSTKILHHIIIGQSQREIGEAEFVTTSSCMFHDENLCIEGSRTGECRVSHLTRKTSTRLSGLHEQNAITVILRMCGPSPSKNKVYFLTAGRDGKCVFHKLRYNPDQPASTVLTTIHTISPPFGPNIEGAQLSPNTGHLILWGFNSTRFVVYNETMKQELMSVECGGAHRNWSYFHHETTRGGSFVWTKASICSVYSQEWPSHRVLQFGSHGREIKAAAVSPFPSSPHSKRLLATGAEDTTIRLLSLDDGGNRCATILKEHTTGLQRLLWTQDGRWLFSAGGCEEFIAWRVRSLNGFPYVVCNGRCPTVTHDKALRIMDFCICETPSQVQSQRIRPEYLITMAYSDSSIRIWRFKAEGKIKVTDKNRYELLHNSSYTTDCLTQSRILDFGQSKMLCTASSDGHVAIREFDVDPAVALKKIHRHSVHQSSIHCLTVLDIRSDTFPANNMLVVTGGDDQALGVVHVKVTPQGSKSMTTAALKCNAHASAITGIASLGRSDGTNVYRFATVGTDQMLKVWLIKVNHPNNESEFVIVTLEEVVCSSVADASCLESFEDAQGVSQLVVAGVGSERWRLTDALKVL
ncbi:uncharacterized protein KY384_001967 [Bacidia gigantensis]|uniref:uncharacterized protein n=1 Tax=Bacidia gigantensis TaxID=2732470 RepID=UPI001D03C200|nr:uncharacterized protein KY384_001967 [Bacidia gigantensis]KAG8533184.1 hypothetical protein KY384_001967 [Bacidia gigantensis]